METVIMRPFQKNITGAVEYIYLGNALKLRYSISMEEKSDFGICKLMLMSSLRPSNPPVVADTMEFKGKTAWGEVTISENSLAFCGYNPSDIDTFVLFGKEQESILSVGFGRLFWDVYGSIGQKGIADPSVMRAREIADRIPQNTDWEAYHSAIMSVNKLRCDLQKAPQKPLLVGFDWFVMAEDKIPIDISSLVHLLPHEIFDICTEVLIGFDGEQTIVLAAKSDANPFENAPDCSVFSKGYWLVSVKLAPEGQYFVKLNYL